MNTLPKSLTIAFLALSIFISGLSADLVKAQSSAPESMVTLTLEEQAWLKAHPEIVLGAPTDYPPMVIKRADGTYVGVLVDIFQQISRDLNSRIDLHIEDSWADIQEKAQNREIDGLAFGGRDPRRDALYNATDIVLPSYFSVFARSQHEYRLNRFSDLDGMRIGYKRAARPTRSLLDKLPSAILKPYDNHESLTQALLSREIDVIVAWMSYDHWRKQKLQGTIDKIYLIEEHPIEMVSYIRNDWPELIPILNKAIAALKQGELPRIINKWFGQWPQLSPINRVQLTSEERAWLNEHPIIRTRFHEHPPYMYHRGGKTFGIVADVLKTISKMVDITFEIEKKPNKWSDDLERLIKHKNLDLLPSIMATPDREKHILFTKPYTNSPRFIFTRDDAPVVSSIENLRDKKIAVVEGYAVHRELIEKYPNLNLLVLDDIEDVIRAVSLGKAFALIGDLISTPIMINEFGLKNLKAACPSGLSDHPLGMGIRNDWPELRDILDKAIRAIPPNEMAVIKNKWAPFSVEYGISSGDVIKLTDEEKDWLDQKHPVRIRIVDYPPYQIIKANGQLEGIVIEHLKLIESRTGIRFKYEVTEQPFAKFLESMKQGKGPDMSALIMPAPEREKYLSFTKPYLSSPYVIFIRQEDSPIFDIQGLFGKTLAVPRGFVVQEQLESDYPKIRLALFDSDEKALEAAATGQADAYIGNLTVASHIIHQKGLSHLKVTAAAPFGNQALSMGNRNDWPELTSIINKALTSITEEEKTAIRNKYLAIKFEQGINKAEVLKWALIVGGTAAGIIFLFVFWNARLSKETRMRKESEAQLRGFLERMPIAACLVDKQENMYYHNKRFVDLFGYKHEEIKTLSDWWPKAYPDDQYRQYVIETWSDCVRRSEEKGTDIEAKEYRVTCKDGQVREMEISGIVLGDRYLATLIDNTERNRAKDRQVAAKEAAEAANQAKSIFLASMSHELRTPLNAILGFSGMLVREKNATPDHQEKLAIINRSGLHLLAMINDVLDLSKIEAGSVELQEHPFDPVALIKEISVMIQSRSVEKGLSVAVEAESLNFPYVKADVGKLRQILINLLNNAVKFTDKGGVTIRCSSEPNLEEPNRSHLVIEVEDTGPGIDPARQAQIFEPFVQGIDEPERKGTGLGLSICRRYAEFMGGTIELESEVGKGSLFRLRLPVEIAKASDAQTSVDDKPRVIGLAPTQKTWRVLVADDNRENLLLLKSLLEAVGFFVLEAKNGKEALEAFKKESPDFIWMDMRMPVMDGYEATRRIRKWEAAIRGRKTEDGSQITEVREQREEGEKMGRWEGENKSEIPPGRRPLLPLRLPAREQSLQLGEAGGQNPKSEMEGIPIIAITASAFREQRPEILAAGCDDMVTKPFQAHEIFAAMGRLLDIEYIYEPQSEAASARMPEVELTSAMLAELPPEQLKELSEACLLTDRQAISDIIDRIDPLAPDTAKGLRTLLENFQIARIHDLLEEVEGEKME